MRTILKIWHFLSLLGVKDNMPLYQQKSIILYNQIIRVLMFIILSVASTSYFVWHIIYPVYSGIIAFAVFGFTLFLNLKGRVFASVLIFSIFVPFYSIVISLIVRAHIQTDQVALYILPRFTIFIGAVIPLVITGFRNLWRALATMSTAIIIFILFDTVHQWFGYYYETMVYDPLQYKILLTVISSFFIFVIILMILIQNINNHYEKLVQAQKNEICNQRDIATRQRDELAEKNTEISQQKEEIETQRDEIEQKHLLTIKQKEEIEDQKKEITDSIFYGSRIQRALLPSTSFLNKWFGESFVFFRPRNIVSGDFHWSKNITTQFGDRIFIAVADCTGHGVPGAFVSMLGISFLNEIISHSKKLDTIKASDVLEELRTKVKTALDQTGKDNEQKDGMDIAFCIYDTFSQQLHYAGAYNPLLIVPANTTQLVEYDATRNPIGIYIKEKPFTNHTIPIQKGDTIYLFSDGIIDQMGGEKNEKFKMRRLMALLSSFGNQSLANQHAILSQTMDNWMIKPDGESRFKQIDDMLLIGIKL